MDTRKFVVLWTIISLIMVLLAWAPWLTRDGLISATEARFEQLWQNVTDGCGFNCQGCGVIASRRVLFGAAVEIEYACGMLPTDLAEYHQQSTVYVSFFGSVHNLPKP